MNETPLLSIVTTNKNDQYFDNQLLRTKFIINYLEYSIKKMNAAKKVEYIVVDWGSDEPLSNYFHKEISNFHYLKFINVPKIETKKCELSFDTTKATNIGIQNSKGKHVMITGSDQFFPLSVFNNFLNMLEKPEIYGLLGNEYKLVPRKFLKDDFCIYEKNMEKVNTYFQSLNHSSLSYASCVPNEGSGVGGHLLSKKQWLQIGGLKDTTKHNRGQDLVLFHETTNTCSHIDTASFGSFLLKLPRTTEGSRLEKMKKIKNPLDYIRFDKNDTLINPNNLEIVSNLNPPKKKLDFHIKPPFAIVNDITALKIIKAIYHCSIFTVFSKTILKSQDILFILKIAKFIKINNVKNIILDEKQSNRFMSYLSKIFPDIKLIILTDNLKDKPLELLKFRNDIVCRAIINNHYGHIKVLAFNSQNVASLNKMNGLCIVEEFFSEYKEVKYFYEKICSNKILAVRKLNNEIKVVKYDIISDPFFNQEHFKKLGLSTFINSSIFILKLFFKIKRVFGDIRRKIIYLKNEKE